MKRRLPRSWPGPPEPMELMARLDAHRAKGLYREHRVIDGPQTRLLKTADHELLNFSSNDYLGLANHPSVVSAFIIGAQEYGVGSGASHLITGHTRAHHELEERLAAFTGRDRALLFSTGYMANLGVLSALTDRHDVIYQDRLNHASLIDAGLLSRATVRRYKHVNVDDLERQLDDRRGMLVTDGVFSMEGDVAPLRELSVLARRQNLLLMVDEAHAIGVLGNSGRGSVSQAGLSQTDVPIIMGTLGKALGTYGAFVAGSEEIIESLIQFARSYVYTTAPPAAIACATMASLDVLESEPERLQVLNENITCFQKCIGQAGLNAPATSTPIQPVYFETIGKMMRVYRYLEQKGVLVGAIRPPTAPRPMLRVTLSSEHRQSDIEQLVDILTGEHGND